MSTHITLREATKLLIDAGVTFAAVPEEHLTQGYCRIMFHIPIGVDDTANHSALEALGTNDTVVISGQTFQLQLCDVLHTEIHTHRRIGMFNITSMYGLDEILPEEGVKNVREFVENNSEPTPVPSDTVDAENLIQELADAGAVAIAVEPMLSDEDRLMLKAWIPPATGYDTVGSYEEVKVGDEFFDLQWEFVWDCGPAFFNQVPIYSENNARGMRSLGVIDGISNLESYVEDGCPSSVTAFSLGGEL